MARLRIVLLAGLSGAFAGLPACWVSSIQPLYDQEHLVYDAALVGRWRSGPGECLLVIDGDADDKTYTLHFAPPSDNKDACTEKSATPAFDGEFAGPFEGRLVELCSTRFLDAFPENGGAPNMGWIRSHTIFKVSADQKNLAMIMPNDRWLCDAVRSKESALGQCGVDPDSTDFIFTASTAVLQELFRKHANDDDLFPPDLEDWKYARETAGAK